MTGTVLVVAGQPDRRVALETALPPDVEATTAESALDALAQLRNRRVDCVVSVLDLPDGPVGGFVERARESGRPVVLVGEPADADHVARLTAAADVFHVDSTDGLAAAVEQAVFDRVADRALDAHERLRGAGLELVLDIVTAESRDAVERAVYDGLVGTGCYGSVWVGEYLPETDELSVRVPATGLLDATSLGGGAADSLLGRLDGEPVVVAPDGAEAADVETDSAGDPETTGRWTAVVPFVHDETRHGLAVLSTTRTPAFDAAERGLLGRIGAVVGHTLGRLDGEADSVAAFAETLIHELRNPVGAAQAHLDIARDSGDDDSFDHIETALDRLEDLVENLSALADMDDPDEVRACDLAPVVEAAWEPLDAPAASLTVEDDVAVVGDRDLLDLLFSNLLRNAVEHGGDGVDIRVGTLDDGFFVEDDGPGVPPSRRRQVFDRGVTGDDGGLGIGLHLVRAVVDAHGWTVDLASSDEGGARFSITGVEVVD